MRCLRFDAAAKLDPPSDRINCRDFAGARFSSRVVGLVANADLVFLVRIKPIPKDVGTILLAHLATKLDDANRFPILNQLLVRQGALPVVLPPLGFPLAAVPVEAVG